MSERGFLSRWSQRKLEAEEVQAPVVSDAPLPEIKDEAAHQEVSITENSDHPEYIDEELVASLPDIETLDADSDFSGFMQHGVPKQLKQLALRKLWSSNPIFANLDGLNDYDEDFKTIVPLAEGVAEELKRLMTENRREIPEEIEETEGLDEEDINQDVINSKNNNENDNSLETDIEEASIDKDDAISSDYQNYSTLEKS